MSTPLEEQPDLGGGQGARSRFVVAMRVLAALSAFASLAALWSVERADVGFDLQLAADDSARPGERIALRALVFHDIDAPQGPRLERADVRVSLLDAQGRALAETQLAPTVLDTLDGALTLPAGRAGQLTLEARTTQAGTQLVCRRTLSVAPDAARAPLHGREAGPLQQLSLGRLRALAPGPMPELLVRVISGGCIPGLRCRVLVWVGGPAAAVRLRGDAAVIEPATGPWSAPTSGVAVLAVTIHGPEAQVTLEASRDGAPLAERLVRLPVALGEVALDAEQSLLAPGTPRFALVPPPGRTHVILDTFSAGRWSSSQVIGDARPERPVVLDPALALRGLVRVQARSDRFTSEGAGARVVYVRAPGEAEEQALASIARLVAQHPSGASEPTAAWASELPAFVLEDVQASAAFLLAPLEQLRASVPSAVSGRPAQLRRLARTRMRMRFGVAGALVLSALVMALSIARRGLSAADQAQAILDAARDQEGGASRRERFYARTSVVLLVLAVAAAFLAGAVLIAAKPLWF